jgi:hypothetical protein
MAGSEVKQEGFIHPSTAASLVGNATHTVSELVEVHPSAQDASCSKEAHKLTKVLWSCCHLTAPGHNWQGAGLAWSGIVFCCQGTRQCCFCRLPQHCRVGQLSLTSTRMALS